MGSNPQDEAQLSKKHEEILGRRAVLLQQMEICYEQQKAKKKQQALMTEVAHEKNMKILEGFQEVENCLRTRPLLHPDVIKLQVLCLDSYPEYLRIMTLIQQKHSNTCYWASVEQKLPEWERYLLGKGPALVTEGKLWQGFRGQKGTRLDSSPGRDKGKPPLPKSRSDLKNSL